MLKGWSSSESAMVALAIALATILGALGSEVVGGLVPCDLCLKQRLPYYVGTPLLLVGFLIPQERLRVGFMLASFALFSWGFYLAVYHAGVEWKWWTGPTACAGVGTAFDFDALVNLNETRVVACDQVQFRFLGLSLAGWNAVASLAISAFLVLSVLRSAEELAPGQPA